MARPGKRGARDIQSCLSARTGSIRAARAAGYNAAPAISPRRPNPRSGFCSAAREPGDRAEQAQEWRKATSREFSIIELPGDHMYLVGRAQEVLDLIEAKSVDG